MNDPVKSCVAGFKNTDTKRKFKFPVFSVLEEGRNIGFFLKPRVVSSSCAKKQDFYVLGSRLIAGIPKSYSFEMFKQCKLSKTRVIYMFLNQL